MPAMPAGDRCMPAQACRCVPAREPRASKQAQIRKRSGPGPGEPVLLRLDQIRIIPRGDEYIVRIRALELVRKHNRRVSAWHELPGPERRRVDDAAEVMHA